MILHWRLFDSTASSSIEVVTRDENNEKMTVNGDVLKEYFSSIRTYQKRLNMLANRASEVIWDAWIGVGGYKLDLSLDVRDEPSTDGTHISQEVLMVILMPFEMLY